MRVVHAINDSGAEVMQLEKRIREVEVRRRQSCCPPSSLTQALGWPAVAAACASPSSVVVLSQSRLAAVKSSRAEYSMKGLQSST